MSDTSPIILGDENRQINELQSTTLQEFFDANPTQSVEDPNYTKTTVIGNPAVFTQDTVILNYADAQISEYQDTQIDALPPRQLIFEDVEDGGIASTAQFSNDANLLTVISPESIASTLAFDTAEIKQTIKDVGAIGSTLTFGLSEGVLEIEEPPLIASTTTFGTPVVTKLISNIGDIGSTVSFPAPTFEGSIFRALIYKDGEISGIGSGESMFVSGGIRINPASRITTSATAGSQTLPSNPVGFISVNINGTDYKVPYYNT